MNNHEQPAFCIEYFYAKANCRVPLKNALLKLVALCQAEEGCLQYDLLEDIADESLFILIVKFSNQATMQAHEAQPYIQDFAKNEMADYCERFQFNDARVVAN